MPPKYKYIRVTVCNPDGEVLEDFHVCHWRSADAMSFSDEENVGSRASESNLVDRIRRYVEAEVASAPR